MATQPTAGKISFADYLAAERLADTKSEYRAGEIFAMAGGNDEHSRLGVRITSLLERTLPSCRIYNSDMKVYAAAVDEGMYPDASVACEEPEYRDARRDVLLNPSLVFEILSPSTREYDGSLKASFYRAMPTVQAIFLVGTEGLYIQRQSRRADGWLLEEFVSLDEKVPLIRSETLIMRDIYDRILI